MTERGAALGVGTLAAAVAALPALPRVDGASPALVLCALTGGTALVVGPALVLAGAARHEGTTPRRAFVGIALAAAPLAMLGQALKTGTHHRPLGAATFAVLALGVVAFSIVVAWRLLRFADARASWLERAVFWATTLTALASVAFVLAVTLRSPTLVPHVLDGLRALATATLGYLLLRVPRVTSAARRVGSVLWALVVVAGLVVAPGRAGALVRAEAPVLGGPLAWF